MGGISGILFFNEMQNATVGIDLVNFITSLHNSCFM